MAGKRLKESKAGNVDFPDGGRAGGNRDGKSILIAYFKYRHNFSI